MPVINENDSVATAEIRFGDNDRLAARVSQMISADTCILLSDIDGLYPADPRTNPCADPRANPPTDEQLAMTGGKCSSRVNRARLAEGHDDGLASKG